MDKKQYLVIGLGRFGRSICETLYENGSEVMALDIDQDRVNECADIATHAVCADAMDKENLEQLGISNFDVAVVNIGTDVKASGIVTMLLKEMGIETVIAKAHDEIHGMMLKKLGGIRWYILSGIWVDAWHTTCVQHILWTLLKCRPIIRLLRSALWKSG